MKDSVIVPSLTMRNGNIKIKVILKLALYRSQPNYEEWKHNRKSYNSFTISQFPA